MVFYFPGDNKTLVKIEDDWDKINLDTTYKNGRFLTILYDKKIAIFSGEKYQKIDFKALKETKNPSYNFTMEIRNQTIKTRSDLEKLLDI